MKMELNTNIKTVKNDNFSTKEKMNTTPEVKNSIETKTDKVTKTSNATEIATSSDGDKLEEDENRQKMNEINKKLELTNHSLQYDIHEKTHQLMIKVVDKDSEEVILEIPDEKSLDKLAKILEDAGLL
ncbi:MAG: flagellar protein FlaG [Lachnospirales bacterium]